MIVYIFSLPYDGPVLAIKRKQNQPNLSCYLQYPYNNNNLLYRYYRQVVTDTYCLAICSILKAHFMLLLSGGWGGGGREWEGQSEGF